MLVYILLIHQTSNIDRCCINEDQYDRLSVIHHPKQQSLLEPQLILAQISNAIMLLYRNHNLYHVRRGHRNLGVIKHFDTYKYRPTLSSASVPNL